MTTDPLPHADAELVRQLAALNSLDLAHDRAEALVPFVQGLLEADRALSALDLHTLPAAGLPWDPFAAGGAAPGLEKEKGTAHGG
jgi:hypothetical protein